MANKLKTFLLKILGIYEPYIVKDALALLHEGEAEVKVLAQAAHSKVQWLHEFAHRTIEQNDSIASTLVTRIHELDSESTDLFAKAKQIVDDHAALAKIVAPVAPTSGEDE